MRHRTSTWRCPTCSREHTTEQLFNDGGWAAVYQDGGPYCAGTLGSHVPTSMTLTGYTERDVDPTPATPVVIHHHTATMEENPMTTSPFGYAQGGFVQPHFPRQHPWSEVLEGFNRQIQDVAQQQYEARQARLPENQFRALGVIEGDRIRLTTKTSPDASQLEGDVIGIKVRDAGSQVRIKGFDHTGGNAGGQHVWFPVADYTIEVLHRAYRWTPEDEAVVEVSRLPRSSWVKATEGYREQKRRQYAPRIARLREVLAASAE